MLDKILKYEEEKDDKLFEEIKKYIEEKIKEMWKNVESIWEIHYKSIISSVYEEYQKAIYKNTFRKRFDKKLKKIINNTLKKTFKYNVVFEFVKIALWRKDVNMEILENWVIKYLNSKGWYNRDYIEIKAREILSQTIMEVINKLNLENWEIKYKSVYSYIMSYLKIATVKILRNENPIDIPYDILWIRNTSRVVSDNYDDQLTKVQKQRKNRIRKIIDKDNNMKIDSIYNQWYVNKIKSEDLDYKDNLEWTYYMKYLKEKTNNPLAVQITTMVIKENYSLTECSKKFNISVNEVKKILDKSKKILSEIIDST